MSRWNFRESSKVSAEIFSMDGKLIRTISESSVDAGKQTTTLNVSEFSPGTYMLVLKVGGQSFTERWVKE
jgi:hypothetical protein